MFSMCSKLTPRARIPDTRIPQLMQPCFTSANYEQLRAINHILSNIQYFLKNFALPVWHFF